MPWWGWLLTYLAIGIVAAWCEWRWESEVTLDGGGEALGGYLVTMIAWPLFAVMIVLTAKVTPYAVWQERRRDAGERRARPSEVAPAGDGRK